MKTSKELKNRKVMMLSMQFMRMVNEDSPWPVFKDLCFDEPENEITFFADGSNHVAIELSMHVCQLFNLTLHPSVHGSKILYSLLGN